MKRLAAIAYFYRRGYRRGDLPCLSCQWDTGHGWHWVTCRRCDWGNT